MNCKPSLVTGLCSCQLLELRTPVLLGLPSSRAACCLGRAWLPSTHVSRSGFFFFIFKKIKISKIYVHFGKFQKYTPVALWGATGLKCNFFLLQICNKVPGGKKKEGACRPPTGDRPLSPLGWATGPVARWEGDRPPFFFTPGTSLQILKKKIYISAMSPPIGRPGYIFEIFQNGHIFLKFYFF